MTSKNTPLHTILELLYNQENVTSEFQQSLIDWTIIDNLSGEIDNLELVVEDKANRWVNAWFPKKGSTIEPTLHKKFPNKSIKSKLGKYEIDEITGKSPPTTMTIKALSVPESSSLRKQQKIKAWENATLKQVFSEIATKNSLKFYWESSENEKHDRIEQNSESDLAFLHRMCKNEGLCLKITNKSIVVLDEEDYEAQPTIETINRFSKETDPIQFIDYSFKTTLTGTYYACKVEHYDINKKKKISATFTPKKVPNHVGRLLYVKQEVSSKSEALKLAKKKLREANKEATTITLKVISYIHIDAGKTFDLKGFGKLDGKYITTKVAIKPNSLTLSLRRCLEGY